MVDALGSSGLKAEGNYFMHSILTLYIDLAENGNVLIC